MHDGCLRDGYLVEVSGMCWVFVLNWILGDVRLLFMGRFLDIWSAALECLQDAGFVSLMNHPVFITWSLFRTWEWQRWVIWRGFCRASGSSPGTAAPARPNCHQVTCCCYEGPAGRCASVRPSAVCGAYFLFVISQLIGSCWRHSRCAVCEWVNECGFIDIICWLYSYSEARISSWSQFTVLIPCFCFLLLPSHHSLLSSYLCCYSPPHPPDLRPSEQVMVQYSIWGNQEQDRFSKTDQNSSRWPQESRLENEPIRWSTSAFLSHPPSVWNSRRVQVSEADWALVLPGWRTVVWFRVSSV